MFKFFSLAALALSVATSAIGAAIPASRRDEASYDQAYLEPYADYNARYNALGCVNEHNTQFFTDCCHPLLKDQTLENDRKAYCNPWTSSASASATSAASSAPVNVAPAPPAFTTTSSSSSVAAAPTTSKASTPTTSKAATPTTASSTAAAALPTNTGHATWFLQHNTAGACGTVHADTDKVIALDSAIYDNGSHCGKTVQLVNISTGKTTTATVADECPTCDGSLSIDLSQGAFGALTDQDFDLGEFDIAWGYI